MTKMTPKKRSEVASIAAKKRWEKARERRKAAKAAKAAKRVVNG